MLVAEVFRTSLRNGTEGDLPIQQAEHEAQYDDDSKKNDENNEYCIQSNTHTHFIFSLLLHMLHECHTVTQPVNLKILNYAP